MTELAELQNGRKSRNMSRYALLVDPGAPRRPAHWLDLPAAAGLDRTADLLDLLFAAQRETRWIGLQIDGAKIGTVGRDLLAGERRGLDDAAGQSLPGRPRYELIAWRCPTCRVVLWRVHADPRTPPACPDSCGDLRPDRP